MDAIMDSLIDDFKKSLKEIHENTMKLFHDQLNELNAKIRKREQEIIEERQLIKAKYVSFFK